MLLPRRAESGQLGLEPFLGLRFTPLGLRYTGRHAGYKGASWHGEVVLGLCVALEVLEELGFTWHGERKKKTEGSDVTS